MSRFALFVGVISALCMLAVLLWLPMPQSALPPIQASVKPQSNEPAEMDFKDVSMDWGVTAMHTQSAEHLTALTETLGAGVCVFDFNRDGWMDIFFVGGSGHSHYYGRKSWWNQAGGNRLLLNKGGRRFEDVTERAGLSHRIWGMGCAVADLDNDTLEDLLVTGIGSTTLYRNSGDGTFEEVTVAAGLRSERWSTGASIADFNRDGLPDIYVSNYIRYQKDARTFEHTSGFKTTDHVAFNQVLYDTEPNQLFLNKGNLMFEDVAAAMGLTDTLGRSLGARWLDLNQDAWLDLIVINDHNSPNQVFINQQGKAFARGGARFAAFEVAGAHDLLIGDFDNRGQNDFFMSRSMSHAPVFLSRNANAAVDRGSFYSDEAWERNLAQAGALPFTGWGAAAGDFNNDGSLDIYVSNGMLTPDIDSHYVAQAQRNSLFVNQGKGQFSQRDEARLRQSPYASRAAITVDLNNDGYLELVVSNNNDPLQILENQKRNGHRWIGLDFSNNQASGAVYGAVVEITTDLFSVQRQVGLNQGFLSQGDPRVHIGLGDSQSIKNILVRWPDGQSDHFENVQPNQYYRIDRTGPAIHAIGPHPDQRSNPTMWPSPLDDAAMMTYATILFQAPLESARDSLREAWDRGSDAVRRHMLANIAGNWVIDYLPWVRDALLRTDTELRLMAIDILKQAELEVSVVWLLPLLDDPDSRLQCATAEAFRFFFDEEEAVTHRKTLAIAPLIKLLSSTDDAARICAANALAAAENKRAIMPLLALATSEVSTSVRVSAIRALGLIRDTSARSALASLVEAQDTDADVVAAALIALNRMDEPALGKLANLWFGESAGGPVSASMALKRLQILIFLFEHTDGIVLSKRQPEIWLTQLVRTNLAQYEETESERIARLLASLRAIEAGRITGLADFVDVYLNHENPQVALQAMITLSSLNTAQARARLERHLAGAPASVLLEVVRRTENRSFGFSDAFLRQLAAQVNGDPRYFSDLSELLAVLPDHSASRLFNTLLEQGLSQEQLQYLFEWCALDKVAVMIGKPFAMAELEKRLASSAQRHAYANCYLKPEPDNIGSLAQLNRRLTLKTYMTAQEWREHEKTALLLQVSATDPVTANTLLLPRLRSNDPALTSPSQEFEAMRIMVQHGQIVDVEEKLWTILKNSQQSIQRRLEAASLLMAAEGENDRESVISYLNSGFLKHDG